MQLLGLSDYLGGTSGRCDSAVGESARLYRSGDVDAAYILGIATSKPRNYPQARAAFARMFDVAPICRQLYVHGANGCGQEFDPIAEEYAQKSRGSRSKLPLVHFLLGELYLYKSRVPEAMRNFRKNWASTPAHAATYYKLPTAYSRIQKFEDAERVCNVRYGLTPHRPGLSFLWEKSSRRKGEFELAVRSLQRAATMDRIIHDSPLVGAGPIATWGKKEEAESELKLAEQLQTQQDSRP